jgi:hypothetical protein
VKECVGKCVGECVGECGVCKCVGEGVAVEAVSLRHHRVILRISYASAP